MRQKLNFYLQIFFCFALASACFGQSSGEKAIRQIGLNVPVVDAIAAGEIKSFALHLGSNQFAVLVLEQKGVDLTLALDEATAGKRLLETNAYDSLFGSERVFAESGAAPRDLLVRVFSAGKKAGRFSLALAELKTTDEPDKLRLAAQSATLEAQKLYDEDKAESKEKGRALLEDALKSARKSGDAVLEKDILVALQSVSFHLGDYSKTVEYGQTALSLPANREGTYEQLLLKTVSGLALINMNETARGVDILSGTVKEAERFGDSSLQLAGLVFISQGWQKLGDLEKSLAYAEQVNLAAKSAGNISYQSDAFRMMSRVYFIRGDFLKAVAVLNQALALSENLEKNNKYTIYYDLALSLISLGQRQKALDYLHESLLFYRGASGNKWNEAAVLHLISSVYSSLGQNTRALEYSRQATEIYAKFGYKSGLIGLAQTQAASYRRLGDYAKEKQAYLEVLKAAGEDGPKEVTADANLKLGAAEKRSGHYDAALEYYLKSRQISDRAGNKMLGTLAAGGISDTYILAGQFDKAAEVAGEAVKAARDTGDRVTESNALYNLARVRRSRNDLNGALKLMEDSLKIIESLRAELVGQESRAGYFSTVRDKYDFYIDLLIELEKQPGGEKFGAAAFAASEQARARSLLDLLAESYTDISGGISPELKERERGNEAKLSSLQTQLIRLKSSEKPDAARIGSLQKEIEKSDDERERLESEIRRTNPRYADLKYPTTLNLAQTQAMLDDKTVFLEYQTGAQNSFLFAVGKNEFQIVPLPNEKLLRQSIESVRRSITTPNRTGFGNYLTTARELYKTLLAPVENLLKTKTKIVVSADGALNYLPFEVLLTGDAHSGFDKLPYLVRDFEISYTPSASVSANLKNNDSQKPAKSFLAFAAPDYAVANSAQNAAVGNTRAVFGDDNRSWNLTDLKNAGTEATRIAALFPAGQTTVFTGAQATEETVKSGDLLSQYRYLHFAVHGFIDEQQPQFSSLVLSLPKSENDRSEIRNPKSEIAEDGLLQTPEIFNLRLRADLVTLSACETGLGQELRGEGIVGLTRAFFYAGTTSVLVSLWKVDDASTAELMTSFYEQLRKNNERDKAAALRRAQLKLINANRYANPYYWASFVLQGGRDATPARK